jgi:hypothetical protein
MEVWQADFYKCPFPSDSGQVFWQLLICNIGGNIIWESRCLQADATADWLASQLQLIIGDRPPNIMQVFRPQSVSLMATAAEKLGIKIEATRRTPTLKAILKARAAGTEDPLYLDKPPPQPLPENLWGESWRFATLPAGEIVETFCNRPLPILVVPDSLLPVNLGIASTLSVPGTIIYGGRKSMYIARWLQDVNPFSLNYIPKEIGQSGGLVLEAGLRDRWIIATFEDAEVAKSAQLYEQRKQASQGLHFLLVQPDDSGVTYSGFWLLQDK